MIAFKLRPAAFKKGIIMFSSKQNDYFEAKYVNTILFRWTKTRNIEVGLIPLFFIPLKKIIVFTKMAVSDKRV